MANSVEPTFKSFTNRPMIIKDHFEISGSDTAQIGWVEVSGEAGQAGYLWYMKAEGDTRVRFEDYLEMTMIEAEKVATSNTLYLIFIDTLVSPAGHVPAFTLPIVVGEFTEYVLP